MASADPPAAPPEVLPTDSPERLASAVARAAAVLRAGGLVGLPTETVYGLAANALDPDAVGRIYAAKGRPSHNPLIVHVASVAMARRCVASWPETAQRLAASFWPGPLTLVLPRSPVVPDVITAGGPTVALRWPAHPVASAVIEAAGVPLAAPSANPSNALSPTLAAHVVEGLGGRVPLVLDGGPCRVGIESTVLDLTEDPPRVLRPGVIGADTLARALGLDGLATGPRPTAGGVLRSPGNLDRHYAPRARLLVVPFRGGGDLARRLRAAGVSPAAAHVVAAGPFDAEGEGFASVRELAGDAEGFARSLYGALHALDAAGAQVVAVAAPPAEPAWQGVADRLARAARAAPGP